MNQNEVKDYKGSGAIAGLVHLVIVLIAAAYLVGKIQDAWSK